MKRTLAGERSGVERGVDHKFNFFVNSVHLTLFSPSYSITLSSSHWWDVLHYELPIPDSQFPD